MQETYESALQHFLIDTASQEEVALLKQALSVGQIAIGGNVNNSIIIIGSGNSVPLPPGAIDTLGARPLLGNLERDLTGDEISYGLNRLADLIVQHAPCLQTNLERLTHKLRPFIPTVAEALSASSSKERNEALAAINGLCIEALDFSFNALCLGNLPPEYDLRCPFQGMESFGPEEAEFFFGREDLTKTLALKLNEHNFLAVLGASGSGKSSLVKAGLIPMLKVPYKIFRPGAEALTELEKAIQAEPALIVVDQFEEIFTLSAKEQCPKFIALLLEQTKKHRVIITLRTDFLGEVTAFKALKDEIQNHKEIILPMDEADLLLAIQKQAERVNLRFEADLSQQMLDDVAGEPGAMPLLQFALLELWNHRHGRWLKAQEYRAFGGVKEAIATAAEKVYAHCSESEREQLRDIFLRLTRLDEDDDKRDTRRRVLKRELTPVNGDTTSTQQLIKKLADRRLVIATDQDVEIVHEALIQHWIRLKRWLNEDRENKLLLQIVRDEARRWEKASYDRALLNHRGQRLKKALGLRKNSNYRFSPNEQRYLDACLRNEILLLSGGVSALLVFLVLAWILVTQERALPGKWINITVGSFVMGMDKTEAEQATAMCLEGASEKDKDRCPKAAELLNWSGQQVNAKLPEYAILDNEVTNAQYQQCIDDGGCQAPKDWIRNKSKPNLPATKLNWFQAGEYCAWLGGRLPTEGEWEKAARGPNDYTFPWGNAWDFSKANLERTGIGDIQSIDQFAATDISGYGVKNMAGNVLEWTASEGMSLMVDQEFSNVVLVRADATQDWPAILRGGSWANQRSTGMASNREVDSVLSSRENLLGFRCVCPEGQTCQSPWDWKSLTWILIWLGK